MDLKVFDFATNKVSFSRTPSLVNGAEQLAQYVAKLLIQRPGTNLGSPEGGAGIFASDVDFFVVANAAIEDVANYIHEQQSLYPGLEETVQLSDLANMDIDYTGGMRKINIDIITMAEDVQTATMEG